MDKNTVVLIALLFTIQAQSQNIVVVPGVEQTVTGMQYSVTGIAFTKKLWGAGAFYQNSIRSGETSSTYSFVGMILYAPIVNTQRIQFFGTVRTGVINKQFVTIVPGVETHIPVSKRFGCIIGTGYRMGYPSLSAKLYWKFL